MFERYPESSRRALLLAKGTALAADARSIDAEHLLAGALEVWPGAGSRREKILRRLGLIVPRQLPEQTSPEIPFSAVVQRLLNSAMMRADRLGHHRIRPEHLLLALLEDATCTPSSLLQEAGLEPEMLLQSAARDALADDSPLSYRAYLEVKISRE